MSFRLFGSAAAAALMLAGPQAFAATFTIDEFTTEQRVSDVPGVGLVNESQVAAPEAVGGYRDLQVTNFGDTTDGTELRVTGGILSFSNIATEAGEGYITYDGNDSPSSLNTSGLGGVNLNIGTDPFFTFDVISFDASLFIRVDAYDTLGGMSTYSETLPEASDFSPLLPFTAFTGDVDFGSIGALEFFVQSTGPDLDGAITAIRVNAGDIPPVPLPASALLLLGGLGSLPLLKRRRKS